MSKKKVDHTYEEGYDYKREKKKPHSHREERREKLTNRWSKS